MVRLVIDSSARDHALWPHPDDYAIVLDDPVQRVEAVCLVETDIPASGSTFGPGNDALSVSSGPRLPDGHRRPSKTVRLAHGDHAGAIEMAAELNAALMRANLEHAVNAAVDTGIITLTSDEPFALMDAGLPDSAADALGARSRADTDAAMLPNGTFAMVFQRPPSPGGSLRYWALHMDFSGTVGGRIKSPINHMCGALAAVTPGQRCIRNAPTTPLQRAVRHLQRVHVRLTRPHGDRYDFRGADHRIEIDLNPCVGRTDVVREMA
jgi:hypothetical protein